MLAFNWDVFVFYGSFKLHVHTADMMINYQGVCNVSIYKLLFNFWNNLNGL